MSKSKLILPPLAFGQHRSQVDLDLDQMQSRVNSITNWVSEYDTLDKASQFQHRTSVYANDGVRVIAVSSTPTVMKVNDPDYTIAIPLHGAISTRIGKTELESIGGQSAVFTSKGRRHSEGGDKSCLLISLTERRLFNTGRVMLGERYQDILRPETPRLLQTQIQNVDFRSVLQQTCNLIDQFNGDQTLLKSFNVDENIARLVVMMLAPNHFMQQEDEKIYTDRSRKVVDHLCDFIEENLGQQIGLTELEAVSGLSARMLQKEFQKHLSCSPLQWVKQRRLIFAQQLLSDPTAGMTVAHVAATCGYSNFSEFSKQYRERFGVLPSETLRRSQSK